MELQLVNRVHARLHLHRKGSLSVSQQYFVSQTTYYFTPRQFSPSLHLHPIDISGSNSNSSAPQTEPRPDLKPRQIFATSALDLAFTMQHNGWGKNGFSGQVL